MEWFELYEKLLNVARTEMGDLTVDDEVNFKKLFYYGLHDWVQMSHDNYHVEEHNKMEKVNE
jgi:hypothetical protein